MVLDDLSEYLSEQGFGTVGVDIFVGIIPSQPLEFICLTQEYGYDVHYTLEERPYRYVEDRIIMMCKNPNYKLAVEKSDAVLLALGSIHNQKINETFYLHVAPEHPSYLLDIDVQRSCFIGGYIRVFRYT